MKKINRRQIRKLILQEMFGGMFGDSNAGPLSKKDYDSLNRVDGDLTVHLALTQGRFAQNILDAVRKEVARYEEFLAEIDAIEAKDTTGYVREGKFDGAREYLAQVSRVVKDFERDISGINNSMRPESPDFDMSRRDPYTPE